MNGNNSYLERQSLINVAEVLFEQYCQEQNYQFVRFGMDEKKDPIRNFSYINAMLRNLPDYIVDTGKELFVVQVKGTAKFKQKEYKLMPEFMQWYSTNKAPLVYAFCFQGKKPKLIFPEKVISLYEKSKDEKWSDGVVFRKLNLFEGEDDGHFSRNN